MITTHQQTNQIICIVLVKLHKIYYENVLQFDEIETLTRRRIRPQNDHHIFPSFIDIDEIMRENDG